MMRRHSIRSCLLLAVATVALTRAANAVAQGVDYGVPTSPAMAFLGASPSSMAAPDATLTIGGSLLTVLDEEGRLRPGLALEIEPVVLLGVERSLKKYQEDRLWYALENLQLSFATTVATSDSMEAATDAALGLRVILYDAGDPVASEAFGRKVIDRAMRLCGPGQPGQSGSEPPSLACMGEKTAQAREAWEKQHWNATRLSIALATGWRIPQEKGMDSAEYVGQTASATGSLALGRRAQGLLQIAYEHRDLGTPVNSLLVSGRLVGGWQTFHVLGETTSGFRFDAPVDADEVEVRWALGAELRVSGGFWLTVQGGEALTEEDNLVVLAGFGLGFSSAAKLLTTK